MLQCALLTQAYLSLTINRIMHNKILHILDYLGTVADICIKNRHHMNNILRMIPPKLIQIPFSNKKCNNNST